VGIVDPHVARQIEQVDDGHVVEPDPVRLAVHGRDPDVLRGIGSRALPQNLEDALSMVRMAVRLVAEEPAENQTQIMDTEAEVLWKLGRVEEAVAVIDRCIEMQPDDEYLRGQRVKFLGEVALNK